MKRTRALPVAVLAVVVAAGCGGNTTGKPDQAGTGGSGLAGSGVSGGGLGIAGSGGSGAGGATGVAGRASASGGTATGGAATGAGGKGSFGGGGSGGETHAGSGGRTAQAGTSSVGQGGASSGGDGGAAGERAIACTGAARYFPEFDRSCTRDEDCLAVAHMTSCCGAQLVIGIALTEQTAFADAESTCELQYPACGCAAFGVDIEDGAQVDFAWQDQVRVSCDAGSCRAHYAGTSFACGTRRCTEHQYCTQSSGGPIGTLPSYTCNPTACTECSCLTVGASCSCSETDGHLKLTCEYE